VYDTREDPDVELESYLLICAEDPPVAMPVEEDYTLATLVAAAQETKAAFDAYLASRRTGDTIEALLHLSDRIGTLHGAVYPYGDV